MVRFLAIVPTPARALNRRGSSIAGAALGAVVGFLVAAFFGPVASCNSCGWTLGTFTVVDALAGAVLGLHALHRLRRAAKGGVLGAILGAVAWEALYAAGHGTDFGPAFMVGAAVVGVVGVVIGALLPGQASIGPPR